MWHSKTSIACVASAAAAANLLASVAAIGRPPEPKPPAHVDFNRDVRPILSENCFVCHGLDTNKRYGGLRLDRADGAYRVLASGRAAIVPGKPEDSELVQRIVATSATRMPPANSGKRLTARQIETVRRWVAEGGVYAPHWAYARVIRPAVPSAAASGAARRQWEWCRGPIDRLLLARLDREGIHPSPEADKRTLLRRVTLDLTGLPPAPGEVAAFLSDTRPGAYERVVDRLLASPHYGERMAQYWLDEVRYADTVGYHGDQDVSVWPYRDYVIRAFNSDMPFDRFTREQLAGDLLPNATEDQRVASGYNRLGEMTTEGGAQDKEYRAKYAADRVRNLSGVWLGATLQCAECHDHKYDPYAQKDFYRAEAFWADLNERGYYPGGGDNDWGPSLRLPSTEQKSRLVALDAQIARTKADIAARASSDLAASQAVWEAEIRALDAAHALDWAAPKPARAEGANGSTVTVEADGIVTVSGKLPPFETYTVTLPATRDSIKAARLEVLGDERLPGNGISRAGWYYVLSEVDASVVRPGAQPETVKIAGVTAGSEDEGYPGYAMIDGKPDTGWATIYGHAGDHRAVFRFGQPIHGGEGVALVMQFHFDARPRLQMGRFRVSLSSVPEASLATHGLPDDVLAAIRKTPATRSPADTKAVADYYRSIAAETKPLRQELARLEGERSIVMGAVPQTLVSEAIAPRTIRILPRGNWMDDSGEVVQPGVPHFLQQVAPTPDGARATRLDLANWLVSRDNPLTARVFVNRLWKLFFGTGIAKNLDDFGGQGEMPVHPELLDWLAAEFMEPTSDQRRTAHDERPTTQQSATRTPTLPYSHTSTLLPPGPWTVKHLIRLIVTSNAYRQSSTPTAALLARDPENRLYARQSPIRLDAEFIRDGALEVSGLLNGAIGGPSVYPYEPRGYLAPLNFPRREWASDVGPSQYRRGLYTHWQRTFLLPALLAFDAPSREEFACTRTVSNTPMQALVLMNDPTFVEAARVFAARVVQDSGPGFDRRLAYAYNVALSRTPRPAEATILRRLYQRERARHADDNGAATAVLHVGDAPAATGDAAELAAWTAVTRAILNLHETITRS